MSARDALAGHRPRLRDGVLVSEPLLRGPRTVHLVRDTATGQSFEVGPRERFLMTRMDGSRTVADLGDAYATAFGRRLGEAHWGRLLQLLGTRGLLDGAPHPEPAGATAAARPANGPLAGSVRLVADAHATAGRLHRAAGFLLGRLWGTALLATLVVMLTVLALHPGELIDGAAAVFTQPVLLMAVATALWLSTALHELAHGVAARHHGGRVGEIGLRWRLPVVIMYCTVEDYPYLAGRRQRIVVAGAGAVANLLFLLPFFVWWLLAPEGPTREGLAGLLFLGVLQAAAMLVPLPPLDGYTIAGQALGALRLAESSRAYLALALRRSPEAAAYPRRARAVYLGYALGTLLTVAALAVALVLLVRAVVLAA
ncbi:peptidase M50 [Streptomyces sp. 3MP-14]|uniref:Peptidase M50 n=1 Tax=Streptomyces mimosae TaxID=2586635 RepID=A0A5N6AEN6_9ACTN|nr:MULTISPECIES: M50 family metallopeptidase [Streptomyces]KAB8166270.1 peptidase M50 [Streptomyces mimosae]KAB8174063.1 peptidase M50 [Streptomyces sp. 3MP-14]